MHVTVTVNFEKAAAALALALDLLARTESSIHRTNNFSSTCSTFYLLATLLLFQLYYLITQVPSESELWLTSTMAAISCRLDGV